MKIVKRPRVTVCAFGALAVLAGLVPLVRACFLEEVSYNEGWNIYNAQTVAAGGLLYPARYGWTTVNYPLLSFWLMAQIHRVTHEYLFTARAVSILSLLACASMAALVVRSAGCSRWAATLAGLFCWIVFCTSVPLYVGVDDPQMLAQAVLLAGLLVYVRGPRSFGRAAAVSLVFAVGLFVKHNQIDLPLAVFLDLLFMSWPTAMVFGVCLLGFGALGGVLSIHYGGPFFLAQLLTPRSYSWAKAGLQLLDLAGPLLVAVALAAYAAWRGRRDPRRRVLGLLLCTSVLVGGYFSGGRGVSANALFSMLLALSLLVGVFLDDVDRGCAPDWLHPLSPYAPWLCFCWLLIPLGRSGEWDPAARLREAKRSEQRFVEDVTVLRHLPGPALCESLLECYEAGKPYMYDPFNATRLVLFGKLDVGEMTSRLQRGEIGAVQANGPLEHANAQQDERFAPAIEAAVKAWYVPVHWRAPDPDLDLGPAQESVIYRPREAGRSNERSVR